MSAVVANNSSSNPQHYKKNNSSNSMVSAEHRPSLALDQDFEDIRTSMERIEELLHRGQNLLYNEAESAENSHAHVARHDSQVEPRPRSPQPHTPAVSQAARSPAAAQGAGRRKPPLGATSPPTQASRRATLSPPPKPKPLRKGQHEDGDDKEDLTLDELQLRVREELAQYRRAGHGKMAKPPAKSGMETRPHVPPRPQPQTPSKERRAPSRETPTRRRSPMRQARTTPPRQGRSRFMASLSHFSANFNKPHPSMMDRDTGKVEGGNVSSNRAPAWKRLYDDAARLQEKQRRSVEHQREESNQQHHPHTNHTHSSSNKRSPFRGSGVAAFPSFTTLKYTPSSTMSRSAKQRVTPQSPSASFNHADAPTPFSNPSNQPQQQPPQQQQHQQLPQRSPSRNSGRMVPKSVFTRRATEKSFKKDSDINEPSPPDAAAPENRKAAQAGDMGGGNGKGIRKINSYSNNSRSTSMKGAEKPKPQPRAAEQTERAVGENNGGAGADVAQEPRPAKRWSVTQLLITDSKKVQSDRSSMKFFVSATTQNTSTDSRLSSPRWMVSSGATRQASFTFPSTGESAVAPPSPNNSQSTSTPVPPGVTPLDLRALRK